MNPQAVLNVANTLDLDAVKAFVLGAAKMVDNLMIKSEPVTLEPDAKPTDWNAQTLPNNKPEHGWISPSQLHAVNQKMIESIKAENWIQGFVTAVELIAMVARP